MHVNSLQKHSSNDRRPHGYIRQSLQRLSSLVHPRRLGTLRRSQRIPLEDLSTTTLSDLSLEKLADAQSITTNDSVSTWGIEGARSSSSQTLELPSSIVSISSGNYLPMMVGGKQARVALSPSLHNAGVEIESIEIKFQNGQRLSWRRPRTIMELPESVRKNIWRKVVVNDSKLLVCDCHYCRTSNLTAAQPPLTRTCHSVRSVTIPIFYRENRFRYPLSHTSVHSVRQWLIDIGEENRSLLRHLELAFLNAERAIESLPARFGMHATRDGVFVEEVAWDDGELGEVQWCIFTALEAGPESQDGDGEEDDDHARSVGTSILSPDSDTNELSFEADGNRTESSHDTWETESSNASSSSAHAMLLPETPPQVHLTRKNGEDFGEPRWSFAGKFNDHVARRLASLSCEPANPQRKPRFVTRAPRVVMASDCTGEINGLYGDEDDISTLDLTFEDSDGDVKSIESTLTKDDY
ncbi:hypothetical protein Q7P37_001214 [Cladosporium fusiforme]